VVYLKPLAQHFLQELKNNSTTVTYHPECFASWNKSDQFWNANKGKGKDHPITSHEGPEVE
jgi:hypothetical protein